MYRHTLETINAHRLHQKIVEEREFVEISGSVVKHISRFYLEGWGVLLVEVQVLDEMSRNLD
jgi:hypothetical protein